MPYYYRTVCYVDYYENSSKCCNIGHVKWVVRDELCTITIHLKSRYCKNNQTVTMSVLTGDRTNGYKNLPLASLTFQDNMASKVMEFPVSSIAGLPLDHIIGIHIGFPNGTYAVALFQGNESITLTDKSSSKQENPVETAVEEPKSDPQQLNKRDEDSFAFDYIVPEEIKPQLIMAEDEENIKINCCQLSSDKWQQLCKMYPVIHPLKNEKDFLSISPKDFVIFSNEYQKLVHNSFLLHGFYNYRHIILGKYDENYYLGVPGTYHDREALVAEMFGFNDFEGVDKRETGSFGYYMTKVKI